MNMRAIPILIDVREVLIKWTNQVFINERTSTLVTEDAKLLKLKTDMSNTKYMV